MMYTTIPTGNYRSSGSASFYSPWFSSGQSLQAGTTSVNFYAWNPSPLGSVFTAELRAGGTLLGSGTFALPPNTYDAYFFSASFATGSHNFANNERLQVRFSFAAPAEIFWDSSYNYSGVAVPSVATTSTPTASPTASPTPSSSPTPSASPTPTNTPLPTNTPTPTNTATPTSTPTPTPVSVSISIDDVTQVETDSGTTSFTFTVSIDQSDPSNPVTVDWATSDGSATTADSDYLAGGATMHERTLVVEPMTPADTFEASSATDTATLSATDELISGMTLTPGAGDYLVWFSGSVEGNTANTRQYISIYQNGFQVAHTEREILTETSIANTSFPVATHAHITTLGAAQPIEIRWRTTGGTATMHERTLVVQKIDSAFISQTTATANTTTTSTTDVLAAPMSLTPGAGDYMIWFSGSVENSATGTQNVSLYVNGAQVAHTERQIFTEGSISDTSFPIALQAYVTGVAASDVIEVRWRTSAGTATMHERTLVVEKVSAASFAAAEDTAISSLAISTTRRLRFEVSNEGTASSGGVSYQLQVAETATCSSGSYSAVPTGSTDHWQIVDSVYITDGEFTSNIVPGLFDEATSFVPGQLGDANNATNSITLAADEFTEVEYSIQATGNSTPGGNYCFRLYDNTAASVLDTYDVYAQASVAP
jgi:hypothetical protein